LNEILIQNVTKIYPMGESKVYALRDISLSIKQGEFVCLLGPSGSGKSTLLYVIGGLEEANEGRVDIFGERITDYDQNQLSLFRRNYIGFVFQSFNLFTRHTASENVQIPLFFARRDKRTRKEQADGLLELVGLKDRILHKPGELSGGQQQRVSIARALVSDPPLILADEPTGNLDSKTGKEIIELFVNLNKDNGKTIIIATHDKAVAQFAHKIVYLRDGCIQNVEENKI